MIGGPCVPCTGREFSKAVLPRLVLRQRENSWQYLASSWAANLRAHFCSGDKSGRESDGMKTSIGKVIIPFKPQSSVKRRPKISNWQEIEGVKGD